MKRNIYSVSQINSYIHNMFAQDFMMSHIAVRGEVSECKYHAKTGHVFFTLKDDRTVLKGIMYRSQVKTGLPFHMKKGDRVVVIGSVQSFERDGIYQLYAQQISREGIGFLYQKFMETKKELEEMGMFAPEYKQPIPRFASRIGVVASPTGAAIRDIENISQRRNPYIQIILYPALVQGEYAARSIVQGIQALEERNVDLIILGRGGGSYEDLLAFNEVCVARAIFDCHVPIVSAVGHETDFTIADYVADMRVPTPSAAGELCFFEISRVLEYLQNTEGQMRRNVQQQVEKNRRVLREYELRLQHLHPENQLHRKREKLEKIQEELRQRMQEIYVQRRHRLEMYAARLEGCSPLKKLQGPYAFMAHPDGRPLRKVAEVQPGDRIEAYMLDGVIEAEVRSVRKSDGNHDE